MTLISNPIKIKEPDYFHRDYKNDLKIEDPKKAPEAVNQGLRVAKAALPFVALYKPVGSVLSVVMGGCRVISNASQTYQSYSEGKGRLKIAGEMLQTSIGVVSIVCTFFALRLGMLVTTCHDLAMNCIQLNQAWQENDSAKAREAGLQILNNAIYLGLFFTASLEVLVASIAFQILLGLHQASDEYRKGNYLEMGAGLLMVAVRMNQMAKPVSTLHAKWKVDSANKKAAMREAIANNSSAKSDITGSGNPTQEVVEILVKYGNNPLGIPALHYAIHQNDAVAVKLLLDHGASVNALSMPISIHGVNYDAPLLPLEQAAASGNIQILDILIDRGADVNYDITSAEVDGSQVVKRFVSPLYFAAKADQEEAVRFLISKGAKLDPFDGQSEAYRSYQGCYDPLRVAAENGSAKAFKVLLEAGAKVGPLLYNPPYLFHSAASLGHEKIVQILIDQGVYVDARNQGDQTALMLAKGRCVEMLLNAGANPKLTDQQGNNALFHAASRLDTEASKLFLKHGVDVNSKNKSDYTPLHWVFSTALIFPPQPTTYLDSQKKYLQFLLDHGADVNYKPKGDERTVLTRAQGGYHFKELIEWLIARGAKS